MAPNQKQAATVNNSTGDVPEVFGIIKGKIQRFGDSVDTDAIIPAKYIPLRGEIQGTKAFAIVRPGFKQKVDEGYSVVVAGRGFGCGSSREEAVSCLRYAGLKAVIAKSFSFIFGRNLLTMNLVGITVQDEAFFAVAQEGATVSIDMNSHTITVTSKADSASNESLADSATVASKQELQKTFPFKMSRIQERVYQCGGILNMLKLSSLSSSSGSATQPPALQAAFAALAGNLQSENGAFCCTNKRIEF